MGTLARELRYCVSNREPAQSAFSPPPLTPLSNFADIRRHRRRSSETVPPPPPSFLQPEAFRYSPKRTFRLVVKNVGVNGNAYKWRLQRPRFFTSPLPSYCYLPAHLSPYRHVVSARKRDPIGLLWRCDYPRRRLSALHGSSFGF